MHQSNAAFRAGERNWEVNTAEKWTHYVHLTARAGDPIAAKRFRYLTSRSNWFYALPCSAYFRRIPEDTQMKYFSTIYQEISRGYASYSCDLRLRHNLAGVRAESRCKRPASVYRRKSAVKWARGVSLSGQYYGLREEFLNWTAVILAVTTPSPRRNSRFTGVNSQGTFEHFNLGAV